MKGLPSLSKMVYKKVGEEPSSIKLSCVPQSLHSFIMFIDPEHKCDVLSRNINARYFVATGLALVMEQTSF